MNKKIKSLRLLYRATRDGDQAQSFHSKCDGIQNTMTVIKTTKGKRFGGFNSTPWESKQNGTFMNDSKALLFSLDGKVVYYFRPNQTKGIYCHKGYGPLYGSNDIFINQEWRNGNNSCCTQNYYDYKNKNNSLNGEESFTVEDFEVFEVKME